MRTLLLPLLFLTSLATAQSEEVATSWPQFRGPTGQGVASGDVPGQWSETSNVRWKTKIAGLGWSSPAILEGQVWVTTALDGGKSLRAVCVDRESGEVLHNVEVFKLDSPGKIHTKNSHATPTPLLDGDRVFVHFGSHGTACLNRKGEVLWKRELSYYHHHGPSACPVLAANRLIIPCDGFQFPFYDKQTRTGVETPQFIVGLDPATGDIVWKTTRDGLHSYATPLVIDVNGTTQVVAPGGKRVTAYDPATGRELWWVNYGEGYSVVPRPVFGNGLVYVCTGYDTASLLAIKPDGAGDVTNTHIAWKTTKGVPFNASPLLHGERLFLLTDLGVLTCLNGLTGEENWRGRVGGNFVASPILAGGKLYCSNETGVTHVVDASADKLVKLHSNKLDGRLYASPAVSGNALFLRTDRALYRIEKAQP